MTKKLDDMLKDSPTHPIRLSWFRLLRENLSHAAIIYRKYPASSDLWHCHDGYYEMVLVLAGKAVNETATGQYQIGRGDIFVMPPESIHHYVSMDGFQHYIILIKPDIFENFPGKFHNVPNFRSLFHEGTSPSPILHLEEKLLPGIAAKIEAAQAEYMNRSPGWLEAFYGEFFSTLISILRHAQSSRHQSDRTENQIRKTIRYMEKKLQEEHKVYTIDGGSISKELGNSKVLNSVVLGLAAKYIGFSKEEWMAVIEKTVPQKTIEINKQAFMKGYEA